MMFSWICLVVRATVAVVIHPPVCGVQTTRPSVPSLALSSGDEEGGEGVVGGVCGLMAAAKLRRARWMRIIQFIAAFSVSEEEDRDELCEETKMGMDGQDIDKQGTEVDR